MRLVAGAVLLLSAACARGSALQEQLKGMEVRAAGEPGDVGGRRAAVAGGRRRRRPWRFGCRNAAT